MEQEENTGAESSDQEIKEQTETTVKKDDSLSTDRVNELINSAIEKTNKSWQSRFDKLLEEKKTVNKEKETTEQRLERLEKEREEERLSYAREKALAKTGLTEDVYKYVQLITSNDAESIAEGFEALKNYINEQIESGAKAKFDKTYAEKFSKNGTPKKGEPIDLSAQIEQARKDGRIGLMLDLQRKQNEG